jgi:PIN domain nuclease of toxin-antitoxin system
MIIIDTHTWIWWTHGSNLLPASHLKIIENNEAGIIGVSAISCWKISKLVEYGRIELPVPLKKWFDNALSYPGVELIQLTPEIAIESTRLPGNFHKDPADQIIVASARSFGCVLVTSDRKIIQYPHVETIE